MPQPLTTTERSALRRFLRAWRAETARSGFRDQGYIAAACHEAAGWRVYARVRAALGPDATELMLAEAA